MSYFTCRRPRRATDASERCHGGIESERCHGGIECQGAGAGTKTPRAPQPRCICVTPGQRSNFAGEQAFEVTSPITREHGRDASCVDCVIMQVMQNEVRL